MPFTFSHPAIIFPVHWSFRKWTSLSGLIIGSMAPDFEKFLKMGAENTYSHTWHGIFWFNLPLGILLSFVFHLWVRDTLIENLPEHLRKRLYLYKAMNWPRHFKKNMWIVAISILMGAASHIFWDDITHSEGKLHQFLPLTKVIHIASFEMPVYAFFDNFSTVAGAVFLYIVLMRLPSFEVPERNVLKKLEYWAVCFAFAVIIILIRLITDLSTEDYWDLVFTSISAFLIGLILASRLLKDQATK